MRASDEDTTEAAKLASKGLCDPIFLDWSGLVCKTAEAAFVAGAIWAKNWLEGSRRPSEGGVGEHDEIQR